MRACAAALARDAVSLNLGDVKPKRRYGAALLGLVAKRPGGPSSKEPTTM